MVIKMGTEQHDKSTSHFLNKANQILVAVNQLKTAYTNQLLLLDC